MDDPARATMPFCVELGITTQLATQERVTLTMEWTAERCTIGGAMHGGAIMSLADSAGAICAFLNLPDGAAGTSTIQSATNFLAAVRSGTIEATATPLHAGKSTIVVVTEVRNEGRLVAVTTQTQTVLRPK
ncbi:MAG: PaaI family thioesterase [Actinomycetia bacterium]|nr:PaaI family thioesterase [Actinomycetes bacterium]